MVCICLKRANGRGSVNSAKCVLQVSGDEEFVGSSFGHGAEIVHHAVCSAFHHGTILIRSDRLDDVSLGDVQQQTCGEFE